MRLTLIGFGPLHPAITGEIRVVLLRRQDPRGSRFSASTTQPRQNRNTSCSLCEPSNPVSMGYFDSEGMRTACSSSTTAAPAATIGTVARNIDGGAARGGVVTSNSRCSLLLESLGLRHGQFVAGRSSTRKGVSPCWKRPAPDHDSCDLPNLAIQVGFASTPERQNAWLRLAALTCGNAKLLVGSLIGASIDRPARFGHCNWSRGR
jgi:hypothetical protein